jgi:FkbM family methyltransferase
MAFTSYAQNFEDVILWRALSHIENGVYVDIGAADPEEFSVTRAFYESGWSGINVEPIDEHFRRLKNKRSRDINLKIAIGREPGLRTLYAFKGTGLSTFDPQIGARHRKAGFESREVTVPSMTLTEILEKFPHRTIHFLKIDVEGAEEEVVESLDLIRFRPWIIVIEATEPSSTVGTHSNWEHLLIFNGYEFAYFDGLNCFYVANEASELKNRIAVPPNLFDDFICNREVEKIRRVIQLEEQVRILEAEAGKPLLRLLRQIREIGDRLTGGGLRALGKRALGLGVEPLTRGQAKSTWETGIRSGLTERLTRKFQPRNGIPKAELFDDLPVEHRVNFGADELSAISPAGVLADSSLEQIAGGAGGNASIADSR